MVFIQTLMSRKDGMGKALPRRNASILSPLRYPGAKRRLAQYVGEVLRLNELKPRLFVEPFAGGASVALQLLQDGFVEKAVLGEKDPLVASFWKTVFSDPEWLIDQLKTVPVNLATWDRFKFGKPHTTRERALACIFLNRTSFSGILASTSGPLGGRRQESQYKLDCRFPLKTLVKRIRQCAALHSRILFVNNGDWAHTLEKVKSKALHDLDVFCYFDPPFYENADRLYNFYFDGKQHKALHDRVAKLRHPWLMSYDPAAPIIEMYSHNGDGPRHVDLLYSASGTERPRAARELMITNLPILPRATRLWRSSEEWKGPGARPAPNGTFVKRGSRHGNR